jgi:hypothetical protein
MKLKNFLSTFWSQCRREGLSTGTNYPGPNIVHMFLSLSVVSLSVDCTHQPPQTKPKSLCKWQSCRFSGNIFNQSALTREPESFFFLAPNPLSAALHEGIKMDFVHSSIYSESRHWMKVSSLRHVAAALPSIKEPGTHRIGDWVGPGAR